MIQNLCRADQAHSGTTDARRTERGIHVAGNGEVAGQWLFQWVGMGTVKPSAQPTQVRTLHLPPPAKTARDRGFPGLAGGLALVSRCLMMCRCEPLHSSGYGHMADGIGPEPAVHRTAGSGISMTRRPR